MEEKGESPQVNVTFDTARPSPTHMALVTLEKHGKKSHTLQKSL